MVQERIAEGSLGDRHRKSVDTRLVDADFANHSAATRTAVRIRAHGVDTLCCGHMLEALAEVRLKLRDHGAASAVVCYSRIGTVPQVSSG